MPRIIDGEKKNLVGRKVRQLRRKRKMTQQELSIKLETMAIYICRGSISRIEDQSRTIYRYRAVWISTGAVCLN